MSQTIVYQIVADPALSRSIQQRLDSSRILVDTFGSVDEYLAGCENGRGRCVVFDAREHSALELIHLLAFERLESRPIIAVTQSNGPSVKLLLASGAFEAMKLEHLESELVGKIERALVHDQMRLAMLRRATQTTDLLKILSGRQAEIVHKVLEGMGNKCIARELQISMRTVEIERAAVLRIFSVKNAVELAHRVGQYQGVASLFSGVTQMHVELPGLCGCQGCLSDPGFLSQMDFRVGGSESR